MSGINHDVTKLSKLFGDAFVYSEDKHGMLAIQNETRVRFRYFAGGQCEIGLSDRELRNGTRICNVPNWNADEMTPVLRLYINPMLVMESPLTQFPFCDPYAKYFDIGPLRVDYKTLAKAAMRLGGRIPTEYEWEAFCRAGSSTLFVFGDSVPSEADLQKWLDWNVGEKNAARNNIGLVGLFHSEWTSTPFSSKLGRPGKAKSTKSIKGGGAIFWPWQDQEWVWCASAMRMPSTELFEDGLACGRIVVDPM